MVDVVHLLALHAVGHRHVSVIADPHNQGVFGELILIESGEDLVDFLVNQRSKVGIELDIFVRSFFVIDRAVCLTERFPNLLNGGFGLERFVNSCWKRNRNAIEIFIRISRCLVKWLLMKWHFTNCSGGRARESKDVMGVDK